MKAYTDISQSKKLEEILPLESADTLHCIDFDGDLLFTVPKQYSGSFRHQPELIIPCWSLASLLDVLESEIDGEEGETYQLNIEKDGTWWNVWYREKYDEAIPIETKSTEELIDACYELVLELHKLNLL